MNIAIIMMGFVSLLSISLVNTMPNANRINTATTTPSPTTPPPICKNLSLSNFNKMVRQLVKAWQNIWIVLKDHEVLVPFEYCFIMNIINIETSNNTCRLTIPYHVLEKLTIPLKDVLNYEAQINNNSDTYNRLSMAQTQIENSLKKLNMQSNHQQNSGQAQYPSSQSTGNHSTISNSTLQGRCVDEVVNSTEKFRDLLEIFLGLNFALHDLQVIQHCLDPHSTHGDSC